MSKAIELASRLDDMNEGWKRYGATAPMLSEASVYLRALDASHRQLLEALEACAEVMSRMYGSGHSGPKLDAARAAIATAKELQ